MAPDALGSVLFAFLEVAFAAPPSGVIREGCQHAVDPPSRPGQVRQALHNATSNRTYRYDRNYTSAETAFGIAGITPGFLGQV